MVKRPLATVLLLAGNYFSLDNQESEAAAETASIQFRDVTQQAGISLCSQQWRFGRNFCRDHGPGVAFIDYDNDGWPDISSSTDGLAGHVQKHSTSRLFTNHDGTFSDVTPQSGLDVELFGWSGRGRL